MEMKVEGMPVQYLVLIFDFILVLYIFNGADGSVSVCKAMLDFD